MSWDQARVDSSRAAIIYATEPVFGGLFGYMAGEYFGVSDAVGATIIMAGVIIALLPRLGFGRPRTLIFGKSAMRSAYQQTS